MIIENGSADYGNIACKYIRLVLFPTPQAFLSNSTPLELEAGAKGEAALFAGYVRIVSSLGYMVT